MLRVACPRCAVCGRKLDERTGTPFLSLESPTDVVLRVVLWRLRDRLSFRDLGEMLLDRGFESTREAGPAWEACFAPLPGDALRRCRRGNTGRSWQVDETELEEDITPTREGSSAHTVVWAPDGNLRRAVYR